MAHEAPSLVSIDDLARSTVNYSAWLEGSSATAKRIGVHGFRFDAHDQLVGVELDSFTPFSACAAMHRSAE